MSWAFLCVKRPLSDPVLCSAGTYSQGGAAACTKVPAGTFQNEEGRSGFTTCWAGYYCPEGSSLPTPCPAGKVGSFDGYFSVNQCIDVARDFWAPLGSKSPQRCPSTGFYCPGAADVAAHEAAGIAPPGSKPIIQATGGSTETVEVPVVETSMTVDITPDQFAAQREAMIAELAKKYGVDPSLITLEANSARRRLVERRQLSGLEITITIAVPPAPPSPDGSAAPASSVDDILNAVSAVDDSALTSALSTALGTTVTAVTTAAPAAATVERIVDFECQPGFWCTAGLVVDCPLGSYNPLENQDFATALSLIHI